MFASFFKVLTERGIAHPGKIVLGKKLVAGAI
jgi:hypothetical protein